MFCLIIITANLIYLILTKPYKYNENNIMYIFGKFLIIITLWLEMVIAYDD